MDIVILTNTPLEVVRRPLLQVHVVVQVLLESLLVLNAGELHNRHHILIRLVINENKGGLLSIANTTDEALTQPRLERLKRSARTCPAIADYG